jgi:hypothetical protein
MERYAYSVNGSHYYEIGHLLYYGAAAAAALWTVAVIYAV